jgi:hypothetical protein
MPPPRDTWDRLPGWYAEILRMFEGHLDEIEAVAARGPRLMPEKVVKLRYLLYGTTGARND